MPVLTMRVMVGLVAMTWRRRARAMPRRWRMGSTARREMRRVEGEEGVEGGSVAMRPARLWGWSSQQPAKDSEELRARSSGDSWRAAMPRELMRVASSS